MSKQTELQTSTADENASLAGRVLVVTGLSGAGRSTALKALEDMNCEAVDNLPIRLMGSLIRQGPADGRGLAIGVDVRTRDFAANVFVQQIEELRAEGPNRIDLVFLDCANDVLARRYTETRRVHPMASDRPLSDGIVAERRLLSPLLDGADIVIDTSLTNVQQFGRFFRNLLVGVPVGEANVLVTSFSYRHGVPRDADMVIDVRFLRNPHYEPELRSKTGRDRDVAAFIAEDPDFETFFSRLTSLLALLLPRFNEEGKSYLTIAIGCTGGQHRSVYVAEELCNWLGERATRVDVRHREMSFEAKSNGDDR
ncbi:MAG: RNase adapter RapZ [Alphaproteobacteria bacterium]|nr:RNase adapter RapZ [Alphaproteobacteria bacterium]